MNEWVHDQDGTETLPEHFAKVGWYARIIFVLTVAALALMAGILVL